MIKNIYSIMRKSFLYRHKIISLASDFFIDIITLLIKYSIIICYNELREKFMLLLYVDIKYPLFIVIHL